jgi:N-acetylglucosamine kinase-like BadF-type ATPase
VLDAKKLKHPLDLLRMLSRGGIDDAYKASLAPLLFIAQCQHADAVAADILMDIAHDISRWPLALLGRYELLDKAIPVVLAGGLFRGEGSLLIDTLTGLIHAHAPHAEVRLAKREPVAGAVLVAAELAGLYVTPGFLRELDASMPAGDFFSTNQNNHAQP